jgi:hypothetical protein
MVIHRGRCVVLLGSEVVRKSFVLLGAWLAVVTAQGAVQVFVEATNGVAWVKYQCTAGEVVRAFALDVSVDNGVIFAVSDFFVGLSRAGAQGYGIFPASFRDHATVNSGTNVAYDLSQYSPLAVTADNPSGTLAGLNSTGVTLELGGLWDPSVPASVPGPAGTLCALHLSRTANVSIAPNSARGGIVLSPPDVVPATQFTGAFVDADAEVTNAKVVNGVLTLTFKAGVLEWALSVDGPWTSTGNGTGSYTEPIGSTAQKFFRVQHD